MACVYPTWGEMVGRRSIPGVCASLHHPLRHRLPRLFAPLSLLALPIRSTPALTMRGTPHVTDTDVPGALLKLAHLADVHPTPVLTHLDFVPRSHLDPCALDLQHCLLSGAHNPITN